MGNTNGPKFCDEGGKSASIDHTEDSEDLGFTVNVRMILPAASFEYLGVTITATGPCDDSVRRRIQSAFTELHFMRAMHILVRGMDVGHAHMIYDSFVVSK